MTRAAADDPRRASSIARAALIVVAVAVAACARPRYLGTEVPRPCTSRDVEGCLGWMMEHDLRAAELGVYDDAKLQRYVQGIVDRLARAALVDRAPRVVIADQDETYATAGRRIIIARTTIEKLATEAELAAVLAHELAHLEGRHVMVSLFGRPDAESSADKRDTESIADERAVWLLERAGYAPVALARALRAVLVAEDEDHPPPVERILRAEALARGRGGFEGRAELLRELDRMIAGRDRRLGGRVGDAWVVPALGLAIALDLGAGDELHSADDLLGLQRGRSALVAYAIGAPWAHELRDALDERETATTALGRVTTGTVPPATAARIDDSPLGKLARAIRSTLPQPAAGMRVAIVERPAGALVIELVGEGQPRLGLRAARTGELAALTPARISIEAAAKAGTIAAIGACAGRLLDDPSRSVAIGDPIKCTDRRRGLAP